MGIPFKKMKKWNIAGWAFGAFLIFGLSQFSIYEKINTEKAYAAWRSNTNVELAADTVTYSDGRIVYKVVSDTATNDSGQFRRFPDLTGAPSPVRYELVWSPNGDSVMIVTADTFAKSPMDSLTASQTAAAWGKRDPWTVRLKWHDSGLPPAASAHDTAIAQSYWFADHYINTADFRADLDGTTPSGINAIGAYNANSDSLALIDNTSFYPGFNSSVRFDWNYTGADPACADSLTKFTGCDSRTIGFTLHNDVSDPGVTTDSMREIWYEVSVRFSDNNLHCSYNESWGAANLPATTGVPFDETGFVNVQGPCAHKLIEFNPVAPWGRSMFVPGAGTGPNTRTTLEMFWADSVAPTDGTIISTDVNNPQMFANDELTYLYDGKWHQIRQHIWPSSDGATLDGGTKLWVDDSLWYSTERQGANVRTPETGYLARIKLGANKDHGGVFVHTESVWWSHAIVWTTQPAWDVTTPVDPPGPDPEPSPPGNEPAGFTRIVETAFSENPITGFNDISGDNEFDVVSTSNYVPGKSILDSVSTPTYDTDDSIGVAIFNPTQTGGTAPINLNMDPAYAPNSLQYNEAYWALWLQPSENYETTATGVSKVGFVEVGDIGSTNGGSMIYFALTGANYADSFNYAIFSQGDPNGGERWTCSGGRIINAGQWHKLEHYVKMNTTDPNRADSANADGIIKVWVDGTLCVDTADVKLIGSDAGDPNPDRVFSRIKWNPTYSSPSPPDTMYQFMSHLYYSGKRSDDVVNEPAGFVKLTEFGFASETNLPDNNWGLNNTKGYVSTILDATAPRSPDSVGQMLFPLGFPGGSGPGNWYAKSGPVGSQDSDSLYVAYWFKISDPWDGHNSGVNKILFVTREDAAAAPILTSAQGADAGALRYQVRTQGLAARNLAGNQGANDTIYRGQWHKLEHLFVLDTVASGTSHSGIVKVWIDGVLTHDYDDVLLWDFTAGLRRWNGIKWNPIWGGTGGNYVPADQWQWVDHLYVSGNVGTIAPPEDPGPGMTDTTLAWWHWNPDKYTTTDQLLDDNIGLPALDSSWSTTESTPLPCRQGSPYPPGFGSSGCNIYLDDTQGYGPFSNSMLYWWRYWDPILYVDSLNPNQAQTTGVKRVFPGPGNTGDTLKEVWVEMAIKGSPGISGCGVIIDETCGHKTIFLPQKASNGIDTETDNGRFALYFWSGAGHSIPDVWYYTATSHVNSMGYKYKDNSEPFKNPQGNPRGTCLNRTSNNISAYDYPNNDGNWHIVRFYVKNATVEDTIAANNSLDSRVVIWHDGARVMDTDSMIAIGECLPWGTANFNDNGYLRHNALSIGRNKDRGAWYEIIDQNGSYPADEKWWTGYVSVFTDNPGWTMWPESDVVEPTFVMDFMESRFANTDSLWATDGDDGINIINDNSYHITTIDTTDGYGNSTRSFKQTFYGWPAADTVSRCRESTTGLEFTRTKWNELVGYTADEFYWELAIKWDDHWDTNPDICELNSDHKIFRLVYMNLDWGTVSTISLKAGNFASMLFVPNAPNQYDGSTNESAANGYSAFPWFDGEWHTIRFGGKRSSAKGVNDGHWWASIDSAGVRIPLLPGTSNWGESMDIWWDTLATYQTAPYFGRNRHIMPEILDQSYWFGKLEFYNENPRWPEFPGGPGYSGQP